MANVLVTGGAGFVGRHLVDLLLARGDEVRVADLAPRPQSLAPEVDYRQGSVADATFVDEALTGVERLYHLAGIAHLWVYPQSKFDEANRLGTETVMAAALRAKTPRVLHCSTESILMPPTRGGAVTEGVALRLEDMAGPYTRSKFRAEEAAHRAAGDGLNVTIVNPTVPIGAGDENFTPPAAMLDLFLKGGSPFYLDCMLNLVDVRDVAEGIVLAADRGRTGERYILGGENIALGELLRRLEQFTGRPMPKRRVFAPVALAAGAVSERIANVFTRKAPAATLEGVRLALRSAPFDTSKAERDLGYRPRPLEPALHAAIEWLMRRNEAGKPSSFGHEARARSPK